jgi:hypothetical protein
MWHANLFFGIAKFCKLGMQNIFSGLQFAFFACNITFQTSGNDAPFFVEKTQFENSIFLQQHYTFQLISPQKTGKFVIFEFSNRVFSAKKGFELKFPLQISFFLRYEKNKPNKNKHIF